MWDKPLLFLGLISTQIMTCYSLREGSGSCDTWTPDLCDPGLLLFLLPLRVGGLLLFSWKHKTIAGHIRNYFHLKHTFILQLNSIKSKLNKHVLKRKNRNWWPVCYKQRIKFLLVHSHTYHQWWHHRGGMRRPLQSEALPPLLPPIRRKKNCQNQPFLANFWIFSPLEMHFAPSQKFFLVPPLPIISIYKATWYFSPDFNNFLALDIIL